MKAPSPKTLAWMAASNLLLAVFMAFDGSHYLAMLNFFIGGFTLSGAIEARQWNRMIKLVDEIMLLSEARGVSKVEPPQAAVVAGQNSPERGLTPAAGEMVEVGR